MAVPKTDFTQVVCLLCSPCLFLSQITNGDNPEVDVYDKLRSLMQLTYDENADSNLGPFTVDARLTSVGGSVLYATGDGRVSCFLEGILQS